MSNFLNSIADYWWSWQFAMLWQAAVLIGVIWIVDVAIRKWAHPQVRYALWMLVLIKLLIPPTWTSPASVTSHIPSVAIRAATVMERSSAEVNHPGLTATPPSKGGELSISSPPAKGEYPEGGRGFITPVSQETAVGTELLLNHPGLTAAPPSKGGELDTNISSPAKGEYPEGRRSCLSWQAYAMFTWLAGVVLLASWLIIRLTGLRREHSASLSCRTSIRGPERHRLDAGSRSGMTIQQGFPNVSTNSSNPSPPGSTSGVCRKSSLPKRSLVRRSSASSAPFC